MNCSAVRKENRGAREGGARPCTTENMEAALMAASTKNTTKRPTSRALSFSAPPHLRRSLCAARSITMPRSTTPPAKDPMDTTALRKRFRGQGRQ